MNQREVHTPSLRSLLGLSTGLAVLLMAGLGGMAPVPADFFGARASAQEAATTAAAPDNSAEPVYSVVSPLGDPTVTMITMAPRLDTLAGKTVCLVWNRAFKADITLPVIGESLKKKYPDLKIISYAEIDDAMRAAGHDDASPDPATLQAVFKEKGCDAVISGNGG